MPMLATPAKLDREAWYSDVAVRTATGITASALSRARRTGRLRYTRQSGRHMYMGQWLMDWLADSAQTGEGAADA